MNFFKIEKINGNIVELVDWKDGSDKGSFKTPYKGFYREGDIITYDSDTDEYVFMDIMGSLAGNDAIKTLINNGEKSYSELSLEDQALYNKASQLIKECFEKPTALSWELSMQYAANRIYLDRIAKEE